MFANVKLKKIIMKRSFLAKIAIVVALMAISLLSCSKEHKNGETFPQETIEENLSRFNASFSTEVLSSHKIEARGFWSKLKKALIITGADIIGAGAGAAAVGDIAAGVGVATGGTGVIVVTAIAATVTGAGASLAAADQLKGGPILVNKIAFGNLEIRYPNDFLPLSEVGKDHNTWIARSAGVVEGRVSEVERVLDSNLIFQGRKQVIENAATEYMQLDGDMTFLLNTLSQEGLIPSRTIPIYNLFFSVYNRCTDLGQIKDIVNHYIETVANSKELTTEEKVMLIASFSVASESPFLWINQD